MGSSASKATTSSAKTAARHFPSASGIQERAAMAATSKAANAATKAAAATATTTRSPKQEYLDEQRRLEEELARYDEQLQKSGKLSTLSTTITYHYHCHYHLQQQ
jgi:uncharacterized FlaG/YvyC family protein